MSKLLSARVFPVTEHPASSAMGRPPGFQPDKRGSSPCEATDPVSYNGSTADR